MGEIFVTGKTETARHLFQVHHEATGSQNLGKTVGSSSSELLQESDMSDMEDLQDVLPVPAKDIDELQDLLEGINVSFDMPLQEEMEISALE